MIGTVAQPSILARVGRALARYDAAFKANLPQPGQLYQQSSNSQTGWISWQGWDKIAQQSNGIDQQRAKTAIQSPWVYADIQAIANEGSSAELVVKQRKGSKLEDVDNHELEVLWESPNPHMGRSYLVSFWLWSYVLGSKSYLYWMPDASGRIVEVWPIPPFMISPIADEKEFIRGYAFKTRPDAEALFIPAEYITYSHSVNIFDVRDGMSFLVAAMLGIETDLAAAAWNRNFFQESNGIPDGLISVPRDTLDTDLQRIRMEIRDFFGGTRRGVAVARGGDLTYEAWGRSQKDAEFLGSRAFDQKAVDRTLGFPEGYWSEGANRANAEQARATMIAGAVWPLLVRLAEDMNAQTVRRWWGDDMRVEFKDIRPEDRDLRLKELQFYSQILPIGRLLERIGEKPLGDVRDSMLIAEINKGQPTPASKPSQETEAFLDAQAASGAAEAPAEEASAPEDAAPVEGEPPVDETALLDEGAPVKALDNTDFDRHIKATAHLLVPIADQVLVDHHAGITTPMDNLWLAGDLDRWERKAIKAVRMGKPAAVRFESDAIDADTRARISAALAGATDIASVRAAFKVQSASERAMFAKLGASGKLKAKNKDGVRTGPREPIAHSGGGGGNASATTEAALPSAPHSAGLSAALDHAERSISINPFESAFVFDADGNKLVEKVGGQHEVSFTDAEAKRLKGAVLTHNHPANVSFSRADVQTAIAHELGEMRAVTGNHRYSLRVPPDTKWTPALESHIQSRYNGLLTQARADVAAGKRTVNDVNRNLHHELWTTLATEQGWAYSRKDW